MKEQRSSSKGQSSKKIANSMILTSSKSSKAATTSPTVFTKELLSLNQNSKVTSLPNQLNPKRSESSLILVNFFKVTLTKYLAKARKSARRLRTKNSKPL